MTFLKRINLIFGLSLLIIFNISAQTTKEEVSIDSVVAQRIRKAEEVSSSSSNIESRLAWDASGPEGKNSLRIARSTTQNNLSLENLLNEVFVKKTGANAGTSKKIITLVDAALYGYNNSTKSWYSQGIIPAPSRSIAHFEAPRHVYYTTETESFSDPTKFPIKEGLILGPLQVGAAEGYNFFDHHEHDGFGGMQGPYAGKEGLLPESGSTRVILDELKNLFAKVSISDKKIYNNAYVTFDFLAPSHKVEFNYIFASEEYESFVGNVFNDIFGFFIHEVDERGNPVSNSVPRNIALIDPDETDPAKFKDNIVAINNINNGNSTANPIVRAKNSHKFVELPKPLGFGSKVDNLSPVEFNGRTKVLTAKADLIPCHRYRMTLAVGNVVDNRFPSAVFLEAESFDLGNNLKNVIRLEDGRMESSYKVYANEKTFLSIDLGLITREDIVSNLGFVNFNNDGTMLQYRNNVDNKLPTSVSILTGEQFKQFEIFVAEQALTQGEFNIVSNPWCYNDLESGNITITVLEAGKLNIAPSATPICVPGQKSTLSIDVTNGVGFYQYRLKKSTDASYPNQWTTSRQFTNLEPGVYSVQVKDLAYTNLGVGETNIFDIEVQIAGAKGIGLISSTEINNVDGVFALEAVMPNGTNANITWVVDAVVGGSIADVIIQNRNTAKPSITFLNNVKSATIHAEGGTDECSNLKSTTITLRKGGCVELDGLEDTYKTISRATLGANINLTTDLEANILNQTLKWEVGATPVDGVNVNETSGIVSSSNLKVDATYIFRYTFDDLCSGKVVRNFYLTITK